jgi:hypothetical protein
VGDYAEYYTTRKPSKFGERVIAHWHKKMLAIANRFIPNLSEKAFLEIGSGHGFFADACQQKKADLFRSRNEC